MPEPLKVLALDTSIEKLGWALLTDAETRPRTRHVLPAPQTLYVDTLRPKGKTDAARLTSLFHGVVHLMRVHTPYGVVIERPAPYQHKRIAKNIKAALQKLDWAYASILMAVLGMGFREDRVLLPLPEDYRGTGRGQNTKEASEYYVRAAFPSVVFEDDHQCDAGHMSSWGLGVFKINRRLKK
jgi:hypothetical protein